MKIQRPSGSLMLLAFGIAACDATGPGDALDLQLNEDVAMVAADAALDDLAQMGIATGVASFDGAAVPHTRSRIVTYYEDDVETAAYNPLTTDSIHIEVVISGAVERERWSASVERTRSLMVTGLEGEETTRIWNGTATGDVSRSRHIEGEVERSYDMSATGEIANVVRGVPREENPWPLSGTITRHVIVDIVNGPNGDETRERTVVIEFNGTQHVTLSVNGEEFELDLAARDRERPFRKRFGS